MGDQLLLNALYELSNLFFALFALLQLWALLAWPRRAVTRKYPLSTRVWLAWPFGTAWVERIEADDIFAFERYQRRSRLGYYLGFLGVLLFTFSLFGVK